MRITPHLGEGIHWPRNWDYLVFRRGNVTRAKPGRMDLPWLSDPDSASLIQDAFDSGVKTVWIHGNHTIGTECLPQARQTLLISGVLTSEADSNTNIIRVPNASPEVEIWLLGGILDGNKGTHTAGPAVHFRPLAVEADRVKVFGGLIRNVDRDAGLTFQHPDLVSGTRIYGGGAYGVTVKDSDAHSFQWAYCQGVNLVGCYVSNGVEDGYRAYEDGDALVSGCTVRGARVGFQSWPAASRFNVFAGCKAIETTSYGFALEGEGAILVGGKCINCYQALSLSGGLNAIHGFSDRVEAGVGIISPRINVAGDSNKLDGIVISNVPVVAVGVNFAAGADLNDLNYQRIIGPTAPWVDAGAGNTINGVGVEDAGVGNPPTIGMPPGIIFRNSADNTIWLKRKDGAWQQIA